MSLETILAGIGAVVTAAGGVILVIRELRRRDRVATVKQIDDLSEELTATRQDAIGCQQWAYTTAQLMIAQGLMPPDLPPMHTTAPTQTLDEHGRWQRRRDRRAEE